MIVLPSEGCRRTQARAEPANSHDTSAEAEAVGTGHASTSPVLGRAHPLHAASVTGASLRHALQPPSDCSADRPWGWGRAGGPKQIKIKPGWGWGEGVGHTPAQVPGGNMLHGPEHAERGSPSSQVPDWVRARAQSHRAIQPHAWEAPDPQGASRVSGAGRELYLQVAVLENASGLHPHGSFQQAVGDGAAVLQEMGLLREQKEPAVRRGERSLAGQRAERGLGRGTEHSLKVPHGGGTDGELGEHQRPRCPRLQADTALCQTADSSQHRHKKGRGN